MERVVLHIDVDAFFCQVEVLRQPMLRGRPIAIQQHQQIIAANYAARNAGVRKRMAATQARELLSPVGGSLVHVFSEAGMRTSYRPYREMGAALIRLLKSLPSAAVVQKASIDEAFVLCAQSDIASGVQLAEAARRATEHDLGITVSVGVAPNPMLAKLASAASKPDGLMVLSHTEQVEQLLQATPVERLPGQGGSVAQALHAAGITHARQLASMSPEQLARQTGLKLSAAARLVAFGNGQDDTPVVDKGPPKSIQVQMTLSAVPLPMPASHAREGSVGGGPRDGMIHPLVLGAPDTRERMRSLLREMARDLTSRSLTDRHFEARWPEKLSLQLVSLSAAGHVVTSRTGPFPAPPPPQAPSTPACLIDEPHAAEGQGDGDGTGNSGNGIASTGVAARSSVTIGAGSGGTGGSGGSGHAAAAAVVPPGGQAAGYLVGERLFEAPASLLDGTVSAAVHLASEMLPGHANGNALVQVHLGVSNFRPTGSATHQITHFFPRSPGTSPPKQARQLQSSVPRSPSDDPGPTYVLPNQARTLSPQKDAQPTKLRAVASAGEAPARPCPSPSHGAVGSASPPPRSSDVPAAPTAAAQISSAAVAGSSHTAANARPIERLWHHNSHRQARPGTGAVAAAVPAQPAGSGSGCAAIDLPTLLSQLPIGPDAPRAPWQQAWHILDARLDALGLPRALVSRQAGHNAGNAERKE